MPGEQRARILDARSAFDGRFEQVAELRGYVEQHREQHHLPRRPADAQGRVAAHGQVLAQVVEPHAEADRTGDGRDRTLPGLVGREARRELAFAEVAADVERGDIAHPDADEEEEQQAGAVLVRLDERQQRERVDDVDEREEAEGRVQQHAVERRAEAGPGHQDEGHQGEHGQLELRQLEGEEEDERGGGEQPPERNIDGLFVRQVAVLIRCQPGDEGSEDGDHPQLAVEDERDDSGDQDDGGNNSFHEPSLSILPVSQKGSDSLPVTLLQCVRSVCLTQPSAVRIGEQLIVLGWP